MRILITGGCGFVGSNLAIQLKTQNPSYAVIAFDNLKRRGSELNINRLKEHGIEFIHGDIRNKEDFDQIGEITTLIEAAAEPSVMSGISGTADYVINTNLLGTINCLNFALKHKAEFVFLSTSRVYPIKSVNEILYTEGETRFNISPNQTMPGISIKGISESFSLTGARSLYGTSKLASELLIQEYHEMYGLKAIINRCGVITGPWQMGKVDQGVVVLWVAKHFWKKELSYIGYGGTGKQVRDVLHVDDLCDLIKIQMKDFDKFNGGTFNVGGETDISISLQELTKLCEETTGNKIKISNVEETRAADIRIYITDNHKIHTLCGWKPKIAPREIVKDIHNWIQSNSENLKTILS